MNVRFVLYRIRRKLHSRMKLREIVRRAYWLEFENESILNFLTKYNVVVGNHKTTPDRQIRAKIQDYVGNEPGFIINVLETSNS
jgi:hypothetical protein